MQRERALAVTGVAIFAVVAGFSACGGGVDPPISVDAEGDVAAVSEAGDDVYEDLSFDFATEVTWEAGPEPPVDAGPDPVVACGPEADVGDAGDCPLPPSRCVDSRWLVSYVNGTCVDGTCKWWPIIHDCSAEGASSCSGDRCRFAIGK